MPPYVKVKDWMVVAKLIVTLALPEVRPVLGVLPVPTTLWSIPIPIKVLSRLVMMVGAINVVPSVESPRIKLS